MDHSEDRQGAGMRTEDDVLGCDKGTRLAALRQGLTEVAHLPQVCVPSALNQQWLCAALSARRILWMHSVFGFLSCGGG